jgi:hypothetical protein
LHHGDNTRFLHNILAWLISEAAIQDAQCPSADAPEASYGHELTCVEARGEGERTIASVERVLRKTGVLRALNRAKWMP